MEALGAQVYQGNGFSLLCCILTTSWQQANTGFVNYFGIILSLSILWNNLRHCYKLSTGVEEFDGGKI